MPTYLELQAEPFWLREIVPPALTLLARNLRAHWGLPADAIGIKGNNVHLRGYHRSREWVLHSAYCTSRTYSVSETAGNRSGGDPRWLCALDLTLPRKLLLEVCQRLDVATRAGRLEKVTEWYGNVDGDTRVDGYDNIRDAVARSDPSHLTHAHLGFDRGRANDNHTDLFDILTGGDMGAAENVEAMILDGTSPTGTQTHSGGIPRIKLYAELAAMSNAIRDLTAAVAELKLTLAAGGPVDVNALANALVDELNNRLAD